MRNLIDSRSLIRTYGMCFKSREVNNNILQQTTFSYACIKLLIYQSKNFKRCTVAAILNRLYLKFVAKWVLLVLVKFMKRVRNFHLPVFLGNPKYSIPGVHKFQLPGVWKNRVAAGKGRKNP